MPREKADSPQSPLYCKTTLKTKQADPSEFAFLFNFTNKIFQKASFKVITKY
jgi:hypothetical protein